MIRNWNIWGPDCAGCASSIFSHKIQRDADQKKNWVPVKSHNGKYRGRTTSKIWRSNGTICQLRLHEKTIYNCFTQGPFPIFLLFIHSIFVWSFDLHRGSSPAAIIILVHFSVQTAVFVECFRPIFCLQIWRADCCTRIEFKFN